MSKKFVPCLPVELHPEQQVAAAKQAIEINPVNRAAVEMVSSKFTAVGSVVDDPSFLAILTTKYWGTGGVDLGVCFLDGAGSDLLALVLEFANIWGRTANVRFRPASAGSAQVRITRAASGYWSYVGTDILQIPRDQPTMNLQGFTTRTAEAEYYRVVCHEFGHTLGCPHEHMRRAVVERLDRAKTIRWGQQQLGWSEQMVVQQILTPVEESALLYPPPADETSIMTYQLPGSITKNGRPVTGGAYINEADAAYMRRAYPGGAEPSPPPADKAVSATVTYDPKTGAWSVSPQ